MTKPSLVAATAVMLALVAGSAWASDPIPDIDVKMGKKPGGIDATTSGDDSPITAQMEESVSIAVEAQSTEELGNLSLSSSTVGVLSNTVLSGQVTGNWTGDDSMDFEAAQKPRDTRINTGDISGEFSAPGVANVLQNAGVLNLQQGVVSMPVSTTAPTAPN